MLGYRCKHYNISVLPSDPSTGLILNYECFGINPSSFHLAITNLMGIQGKNFVFEPEVDAEIWNHPVWKYNSTYYNPITLKQGEAIDSIVTIEEARNNNAFLNYVIKNEFINFSKIF
jgi:hypothetical protein